MSIDSWNNWSQRDNAHVWHPFTPMEPWLAGGEEPGRVIVEAEGFELIDSRGRRFIDGFSSLWCNLHGHRVAEIDEAIRGQLGRVAHTTLLGHASPPSIELAERLVRLAPKGLTKVFYSDSGATAFEVALKMAYQYWRNRGQSRRRRFVAFREGYHGDTVGSVSVGGIDTFHRMFRPLLFEATFVDTPNAYHNPAGEKAAEAVLGQIDAALSAASGEYCAVLIEPLVQGAGGMLTHPVGFLAAVRELTRRHDVLLIADEVATGFCRTGRMFACEHAGVSPDLLCLGKGLSGGYLSVAAAMASQEIFDAFLGEPHEGKTFFHGHTFTGNALGCAAAVASVDLIGSSGLLDRLPAKAERIAARLSELREHPNVGDVRQCGMMVGIELVKKRGVPGTQVPQRGVPGTQVPGLRDARGNETFDPRKRIGAEVCFHARRHGVIIRPLGDVVVLMPAPAMDPGTLERLLDATVRTIHEYFAERRV
jgi:adenosylmethionine-8-amino-7-oxononanoate aminotransferase